MATRPRLLLLDEVLAGLNPGEVKEALPFIQSVNVDRGVTLLVIEHNLRAIMGAFYAHYVRFLSPDTAFEGSWSVMPIVASLFGGMQTLIGPMAGALVITGLDEFVFKRFFETGHKLFFGLLLAVVIVWAPTGLLGNRVRRVFHGDKK